MYEAEKEESENGKASNRGGVTYDSAPYQDHTNGAASLGKTGKG